MCSILIKAGANVHCNNENNENILMLLLENVANFSDNEGEEIASLVQLAITRKVDLDSCDFNSGSNALMIAL